MAAILGAWLPLSLLLLFSSSFLSSTAASASHPFSSSSPQRRLLQSNSPPPPPPTTTTPPNRNIETFFPSLASPAFPNLVPPPPPPPPPPAQPPPSQPPTVPPPKSQDNKVTTAVVATAASSFAVSGLLFFAFHQFSAKRRREAHVIDSRKSFRADRHRSRANLELKGVIVDENGLDAIYLREFNKEGQRRCRHCNHALDPSGRQEEDNPGSRPRNDRRIQESPLIPPGSVNSSSRIFHEPRISSQSSSSTFSVVAFDSVPARARPVSSPSPPSPPANISTPSPPRPPPLPPGPVPPPPPVMKANASSAIPSAPAPPPPPPPPPVIKTNASPALPTAPAPPPPPPPPVMKANASPSPPRAPAPPPPPRGSSGTASSSFRPPPAPAQSSDGGPKKLKPLHWDKVNPSNADHSMVWDKISGGSFRVDEGIMEALFGTLANRRSPRETNNPSKPFPSSTTLAGTAAQICLIDSRKSQNIAIVLRSLALSRQDILDALLDGRGLSNDTLEKLSRLAPTKEEEDMIRDFSGNPSKLADAESFLFHLLRAVPSPFARLDAMLFRSNYGPDVASLKESLLTLELACKELKKRGLFLKLLEAVLKAGNRMNAGTARGNAQAFNLKALCKLSDVKSTDGATTLLHFVVQEVVRSEGKRCAVNHNYSLRRSGSSMSKTDDEGGGYSGESTSRAGEREEREKEYVKLGLPIVGGLSVEFANVKKAAGIDYDALVATCTSLGARVKEIRQFLESCSSGGFAREMREFVEAAEEELEVLRGEQVRVMELVKRTTEYYQPGASKDKRAHPLQLFTIIRDFLGMVDRTCVDIARKLQKKKLPPPPGAAATSPEWGRRVTARFPNLPAHFLSDNSKSDSSSDEEDGS